MWCGLSSAASPVGVERLESYVPVSSIRPPIPIHQDGLGGGASFSHGILSHVSRVGRDFEYCWVPAYMSVYTPVDVGFIRSEVVRGDYAMELLYAGTGVSVLDGAW